MNGYIIYYKEINVKDAMEIPDHEKFYKWLGYNHEEISLIEGFTFNKDTIEIHFVDDFEENKQLLKTTDDAMCKFKEHCSMILKRIANSYDYYHSDEWAIEFLHCNDIQFLENGKLFEEY